MSQRRESARRSLSAPALRERGPSEQCIEGTLGFLTPVFGGGVRIDIEEPQLKERDPITAVRPASVRGQLREWWRRTCGLDERGEPLPLEVLRAREEVIWGWASTQAKPRRGWVSVDVDDTSLRRRDLRALEKNHNNRWVPSLGSGIAYGTFPLSPQNANGNRPAGILHEYTGTFRVTLRAESLGSIARAAAVAAWPEHAVSIEEHLWREVDRAWLAWVTFGGFGGRTRRGFGAIRSERDRLPLGAVLQRLGWADRCALLGSGNIERSFENGLRALDAGLGKLKDFRQQPGLGRNHGSKANQPGRSRWPEPDTLRRLTGMYARQHAPEHPVQRFPRAAFGMPIIFHFKDQGEPPDQSLQPRGAERLASPLVIRPVMDGDDIKVAALRLPELQPLDDILRELAIRGSERTLSGALDSNQQGQIAPLRACRERPASGADAVFEPFFRFFRGHAP